MDRDAMVRLISSLRSFPPEILLMITFASYTIIKILACVSTGL